MDFSSRRCSGSRFPTRCASLNPRTLWRNPVMFIVEVGAVWSNGAGDTEFDLVRLAHRVLAVAHRRLRQPRRGRRRRSWQGPGRDSAQDEVRHLGPSPDRLGTRSPRARGGSRPRHCCSRARSWSSRPGRSSRVTATSLPERQYLGQRAGGDRRVGPGDPGELGGDRSAVTGGTTVIANTIIIRITA